MAHARAHKVNKDAAKRKHKTKNSKTQRLRDNESVIELDQAIHEQQHIRAQIDQQTKRSKKQSPKSEAWETLRSINDLVQSKSATTKRATDSKRSGESNRLMNSLLEGLDNIDVSNDPESGEGNEKLSDNRNLKPAVHSNNGRHTKEENELEIEI